jgi:outer membrane protein assembly factor BamB
VRVRQSEIMADRVSRRKLLTAAGTMSVIGSAGCSELPVSIGDSRDIGKRDDSLSDEWPTIGQNPRNTKFNPGGAGPKDDPSVEWTYEAEHIFTPPALAGDTIVLSGIESLTILNTDGTRRWETTYQGIFDELRKYTSPVVVTEDIICSAVRRDDRRFQLVGFTPSGEVQWSIDIGNPASGATPFVTHVDGVIYASFGTRYDEIESPATVAINAETGDILRSMGAGEVSFTYPLITERYLLTHAANDRLYAFDTESGDIQWEFDTLNNRILRPVVSDDTVYVQYGNGVVGLSLEDGSISVEATDRFGGEFALVDGVVIEPADDTLRAYDLQRDNVLWEQEYPASLNPPAVADGVAYIGGEDKRIRGIEIATGDELWSRQLDDDVMRPIVAQDRVLAVSGDTLYSLG